MSGKAARPHFARRRARAPEHGIQASIRAWWMACVKEPQDGFLFAVTNGAKRAAERNGVMVNGDAPPAWWLIAEGLRAGVSDLVMMVPGGKTVFIEVKLDDTILTKKTYQNDAQEAFEKTCNTLGHPYRIARSIEDFADICDEFQVPYRARPFGPKLLKPVKAAPPKPLSARRAKAGSGQAGKARGNKPSASAPDHPTQDPPLSADPIAPLPSPTRRRR